jgi:outer membrane protein
MKKFILTAALLVLTLPVKAEETQLCKGAFVDAMKMPSQEKVETISKLKETLDDFTLLSDGVIYAGEKADFTLLITNKNESEINSKIDELRNKTCKYGFIDIPKVLGTIPQAEDAKQKLQMEFKPKDDELVAMQSLGTASDDEIALAKSKFSEEFNNRRSEELNKLQKTIVNSIRTLAKSENYDILITDETPDVQRFKKLVSLKDLTADLINMLKSSTAKISDSTQSENKNSINKASLENKSTTQNTETAETKCKDLGFKPKTEKFGECVLKLMK